MKHKNYSSSLVFIVITFIFYANISAYIPTNFYRPFDIDFRLNEWQNNSFRFGTAFEYGETTNCRDWDENKRNALQLYNQRESSIGMLLGASSGSEIEKLAQSLGLSAATATDDNYRGRFIVTGDYEEFDYTFFMKYKLPQLIDGTFEIDLFVPLKTVEFKNVSWSDQTQDFLTADKEFKETISSQIISKAQELGGLNINPNGFKKSGLGDLTLMLGWYKNFVQEKEYIKNTRVYAQVGLSIPTGEKKDQDQSLSLPLGYNGAWGIPAGLGLDVHFVYHLRAGINLDFLGIFNKTGEYRMKTSRYQTDFLLLHKGQATFSQGASWKFTLYGQAKKILPGLSATISYHFIKHDEDRLSPKSYTFDYSIINSAQSLKEWSAHSFVFQAAYDLFKDNKKRKFRPHISAFYKLPVAGKRVLLANTFGGQIAFNF